MDKLQRVGYPLPPTHSQERVALIMLEKNRTWRKKIDEKV
tara:strand:- start:1786 stop:1905 length:120 start_codon:yes stop_codon:yes gene_type:complete